MSQDEALQKAHKLKAEALGISSVVDTYGVERSEQNRE